MFLLALHLHYFFLFLHFLLLFPMLCLYGGCAFALKVGRLKDPELRKLAEGFPSVPLKQIPHQQPNNNIQEPFKILENGLLALRKSFARPLMRCQLLFT